MAKRKDVAAFMSSEPAVPVKRPVGRPRKERTEGEEPKRNTVRSISMPTPLWERVEAEAKKEFRSINAEMAFICAKYFQLSEDDIKAL